jgi:hypothetical protein
MPCEARHRLGDVSKAVGGRIPAALLSVHILRRPFLPSP